MSTVSADAIRSLEATLGRVPSLRSTFERISRDGPAASSAAESERLEPLGDLAWNGAINAWASGADHALLWHVALFEAHKAPMSAHATLSRAAIEGAAITRWLADQRVTPAERRRRGVGFQLADYRERQKFEQSSGLGRVPRTPPARSAAERVDELQREMGALKLSGKRMPNSTELFQGFGLIRGGKPVDLEWLYRATSAFAHGQQWSILLLERGEAVGAVHASRSQSHLVSADDRFAVALAAIATEALAGALDELRVWAEM